MINRDRPRGQFRKLTKEQINEKRYWWIGGTILTLLIIFTMFSGVIERHLVQSYRPKITATTIKNSDEKK